MELYNRMSIYLQELFWKIFVMEGWMHRTEKLLKRQGGLTPMILLWDFQKDMLQILVKGESSFQEDKSRDCPLPEYF